ncbi:MAG: trypsin-like serine protease [Leptolyngbya sp. SIO1E4]|nr:trypsin-like serine protease [Leptolyngbya sp. SIO1E4]
MTDSQIPELTASAYSQAGDFSQIQIAPLIVAGDPNPNNALEADSPEQRIDPNLATSPYAGVGSLEIVAPGIGSFLCSGAAISTNHVLTAAHCLDTEGDDGILDLLPENVTFNVNAQGESAPPLAILADALNIFDTGTERYEGFTTSINNDLAIITLSQALPEGIPIYELSRDPLPLNSVITLVGYGTTGNGIEGHRSGTANPTIKRVGQNAVDDASLFSALISETDEVFTFDFDGPDASTNTLAALGSGVTLGNQIETTIGPGDSGGPSFIPEGDRLRLVGVNTFGFALPDLERPQTEVVQGTFGTGGGGVLISDPDKLAWIESIIGTAPDAELGSIQGVKWHDLNGDGDRDPSEPTIPDWTIYLDLNGNNVLDIGEPTALTDEAGTYTFSGLESGTYIVAEVPQTGWQQTFPAAGTVERFRADFSDGTVPDLDGFTVDNTGAPVPGLWHLTTGRGAQPGHSPEHSLYFGQNESAIGGGNYDVGHTAGRVTSPEIDLTGLVSAELTFNYFLNVEFSSQVDDVQVLVAQNNGSFQPLASKGDPLTVVSNAAERWLEASIDLSDYVGSTVQVQFDFDTVDSLINGLEGWFIDDVVVQGVGSDRHTVVLGAGQTVTGIDFGNLNNDLLPTTSVALGLFDYEQFLRYQTPDATAPIESVDGLPLAQLFDETFYLNQNPDVAAAVNGGIFASGYAHFVALGLAEGRNPSILYDEAFYLSSHRDVAQAVNMGFFASGLDHFLQRGHEEGRDPSSAFSQADYLINNPGVATAVNGNAFQSGFEHYLKFGANENRLPMLSLYNEAFYLQNNPGVSAAVARGDFADGLEHFARFGQFEQRSPSSRFDPGSYLSANPDVAAAVNAGFLASAFEHYVAFGRFEGRPVA